MDSTNHAISHLQLLSEQINNLKQKWIVIKQIKKPKIAKYFCSQLNAIETILKKNQHFNAKIHICKKQ